MPLNILLGRVFCHGTVSIYTHKDEDEDKHSLINPQISNSKQGPVKTSQLHNIRCQKCIGE